MFHAFADLWARWNGETCCVWAGHSFNLLFNKRYPDYSSSRWGWTHRKLSTCAEVTQESCRNVNTAHCHQRNHNKEEPAASHMHQEPWECLWKTLHTCDDRSRRLAPPQSGFLLCPALIIFQQLFEYLVFYMSIPVFLHCTSIMFVLTRTCCIGQPPKNFPTIQIMWPDWGISLSSDPHLSKSTPQFVIQAFFCSFWAQAEITPTIQLWHHQSYFVRFDKVSSEQQTACYCSCGVSNDE